MKLYFLVFNFFFRFWIFKLSLTIGFIIFIWPWKISKFCKCATFVNHQVKVKISINFSRRITCREKKILQSIPVVTVSSFMFFFLSIEKKRLGSVIQIQFLFTVWYRIIVVRCIFYSLAEKRDHLKSDVKKGSKIKRKMHFLFIFFLFISDLI